MCRGEGGKEKGGRERKRKITKEKELITAQKTAT
jgi:hypothetical protein